MALHPSIRTQLMIDIEDDSLTLSQIDIIVNNIVFSN